MRRPSAAGVRLVRVLFAVTSGALVAPVACGETVDLGGAADAGDTDGPADGASSPDADDAAAPLAECDPCAAPSECGPNATCAPIGGSEGFCVSLCPRGVECDNDDSCRATGAVGGGSVDACVPIVDACAPATAPPGPDGAPLDRCGEVVGPTIASTVCHSCDTPSACQANGCYGGWWCNQDTHRCQKPPSSCK